MGSVTHYFCDKCGKDMTDEDWHGVSVVEQTFYQFRIEDDDAKEPGRDWRKTGLLCEEDADAFRAIMEEFFPKKEVTA